MTRLVVRRGGVLAARLLAVAIALGLLTGCASTPRVGERTAKGSVGDPVDQRLPGPFMSEGRSCGVI